MRVYILSGISTSFPMLSQSLRQVVYLLLTRSPLNFTKHWTEVRCRSEIPFDLHVLGMPPAFILSQDQTLHKYYNYRLFNRNSSLDLYSVFKDQITMQMHP
jgi:hypothetical protein